MAAWSRQVCFGSQIPFIQIYMHMTFTTSSIALFGNMFDQQVMPTAQRVRYLTRGDLQAFLHAARDGICVCTCHLGSVYKHTQRAYKRHNEARFDWWT
jgi:hypothetical protein